MPGLTARTKMADPTVDWSAEANTALQLSLVTPDAEGGAKVIHTFHPKMTYAIFGEDERIFGYQNLKINLKFNACDMRPGLQIFYSKKFKSVGETQATDLKELLGDFLPQSEPSSQNQALHLANLSSGV